MKIAADYGFKVENDGLANARALQSAVEGGGDVYYTHMFPSNSRWMPASHFPWVALSL